MALTPVRLQAAHAWEDHQPMRADLFPVPSHDRPSVSVVIPALNEAKNLPHVLPRIPAWIDEVLLVPGHSTDETVAVAQALWPSIRVVEQQGRGKGAALRAGFAAATSDIIVMLDADGSMDPGEIPAFVGALLAGADFVKGSRFLQGGGTVDMEFYRRWGNWGLKVFAQLLFGGTYTDLCYGYMAFWRRVLPQLNPDCDGFEIETLMNVRACIAGLKLAEVPSFEAERIHGVSNLRTIPDGWRILKTMVREKGKVLRGQTVVAGAVDEALAGMNDTMLVLGDSFPSWAPVASTVGGTAGD
jgi:glycosyltransferase involved in cell wall biosynthesis